MDPIKKMLDDATRSFEAFVAEGEARLVQMELASNKASLKAQDVLLARMREIGGNAHHIEEAILFQVIPQLLATVVANRRDKPLVPIDGEEDFLADVLKAMAPVVNSYLNHVIGVIK